jgi:hypothetical protein
MSEITIRLRDQGSVGLSRVGRQMELLFLSPTIDVPPFAVVLEPEEARTLVIALNAWLSVFEDPAGIVPTRVV